jgi:hypothetical protein
VLDKKVSSDMALLKVKMNQLSDSARSKIA